MTTRRPLTVKYSNTAQGDTPPAFAVVIVPFTQNAPEAAHMLPRLPDETGSEFHARALAEADTAMVDDVAVLFTDVLPPLTWRQQWQRRATLRWMMLAAHVPTSLKLKAADEMVKLLAAEAA